MKLILDIAIMMNFKNIKVNFALLSKAIGIVCIATTNAFLPLDAVAKDLNCVNFWTNPSTGKNECFSGEMTLIAEPQPILPSDTYNIGGKEIIVPSPDLYVRVTPEMGAIYRYYTSAKDPFNRLLAGYISQSDAKIAIDGEFPSSSKGFYLQVLKAAERETVNPQYFAKIQKDIKTQNKKVVASNMSKLQEIVKENGEIINQELGIDAALNLSQVIPLDPHYESKNTFSYSMYLVSEIAVMGEKKEFVMAATVTLINVSEKVVSLYSFGEQADLEWTRNASQVWAEKTITSNP